MTTTRPAGIIRVQQDRLDWHYLERWAADLGLLDMLARARQGGRSEP